jgi:hypothetical protein
MDLKPPVMIHSLDQLKEVFGQPDTISTAESLAVVQRMDQMISIKRNESSPPGVLRFAPGVFIRETDITEYARDIEEKMRGGLTHAEQGPPA